jgi:hypothetical protein
MNYICSMEINSFFRKINIEFEFNIYLLLRDDFRIGLVINHNMGIYKIDIFIN